MIIKFDGDNQEPIGEYLIRPQDGSMRAVQLQVGDIFSVSLSSPGIPKELCTFENIFMTKRLYLVPVIKNSGNLRISVNREDTLALRIINLIEVQGVEAVQLGVVVAGDERMDKLTEDRMVSRTRRGLL